MKVPEPEQEQPLAWKAILKDTPVHASDGQEVGVITEVLGSEDIFHGIVVHRGVAAHDVEIPAEAVVWITNKRINTTLSQQEIRELPVYQPEDSYKLGIVGLLGKHLGWVSDDREGE
jgi:hypothetical protein